MEFDKEFYKEEFEKLLKKKGKENFSLRIAMLHLR